MSRIDHTWVKTAPPKPDVYTTRRNESKYLTLRYWDGECWYELAYSDRRGGKPFTWPKKSRTRQPTLKSWNGERGKHPEWFTRKISAKVGAIQWGEPFKVYDEKEVLAWLVERGQLRADWRTAYQEHMRNTDGGAK
jgi:hypothetical protein